MQVELGMYIVQLLLLLFSLKLAINTKNVTSQEGNGDHSSMTVLDVGESEVKKPRNLSGLVNG